MKNVLFILSFLLLFESTSSGQSFISINPDSALQGQNVTTSVTGTGFFFTMGSGPTAWGNFYMTNNGTYLYPNWLTIITDDLFEANWTFPNNMTPGNWMVIYEVYDPWNPWPNPTSYLVPGGFTVVSCPAPAVTISAQSATTFCSGGNVVLSATSIPGVTYQWYRYGGLISGATSQTFTATMAGDYKVTVSTAAGCQTTSNTISVSVLSLPYSSIGYTGLLQFCPGGSKLLYAYNSSGNNYQWYLNTVAIAGAVNQSYTATVAGNYSLRVTNSSGCSSLSTLVVITVLPAPAATITPSGPTTFCAGTGITLTANSGTGLTYQWFKFGNPIAGATSQSIFVSNAAKYKVQVTNANGCTKKSANLITTVVPLPTALITAQGPTTFCAGDSVRLAANTGAGLTYQWKKYANPIAGATGSSYTAKNAGKYKVVVTNTTGCSRTSNAIVVSVPCRLQGVDLPEGELFVFDDQSQRKLFVEGNWSGPVELISVDGKRILNVANYTSDGIDLTGIPSGLYVAIIRTEQEVITHKFFYSR